MSGFELRVNGNLVRTAVFEEGSGEQGVLDAMVEWISLREHEVCRLVDLPDTLIELSPGDEISVRVISGPLVPLDVPPSPSRSDGYRTKPRKPRELALDLYINGRHVQHQQSPRIVHADVCWIVPTEEMTSRGVSGNLRLASSAYRSAIDYRRLAPGDEVKIVLSEVPVAAAEENYADDRAAGAA